MIEQKRIAEIIRPAENGMTSPYLCRLDDDASYFVKGTQATASGLISEVIAATLGRAFGLPVPDFCIGQASEALLGLNEDARSALGNGWCFASRAEPAIVEMTFTALNGIPRDFHQRLFLFDYWISNGDRTLTAAGGNPNLFMRLTDKQPIVIDHNLAFAADFTLEENRKSHLSSPYWYQPTVDLIYPQQVRNGMEEAFSALAEIEDQLPEDWLDRAPTLCANAIESLQQFRSAEFWDALK